MESQSYACGYKTLGSQFHNVVMYTCSGREDIITDTSHTCAKFMFCRAHKQYVEQLGKKCLLILFITFYYFFFGKCDKCTHYYCYCYKCHRCLNANSEHKAEWTTVNYCEHNNKCHKWKKRLSYLHERYPNVILMKIKYCCKGFLINIFYYTSLWSLSYTQCASDLI